MFYFLAYIPLNLLFSWSYLKSYCSFVCIFLKSFFWKYTEKLIKHESNLIILLKYKYQPGQEIENCQQTAYLLSHKTLFNRRNILTYSYFVAFLFNFPTCIFTPGLPWWHSGKRICLPLQAIQVQSLGQEDPLEKEMAAHSSILPGTSQGQRWAAVHGVAKKLSMNWATASIFTPRISVTVCFRKFYVWTLCSCFVSLNIMLVCCPCCYWYP